VQLEQLELVVLVREHGRYERERYGRMPHGLGELEGDAAL